MRKLAKQVGPSKLFLKGNQALLDDAVQYSDSEFISHLSPFKYKQVHVHPSSLHPSQNPDSQVDFGKYG